MVRRLLFLLNVLYFSMCFSQDDSIIQREIELISIIDSWPVFENGVEGLNSFINNNIHYPDGALNDSVEGKVYVTFLVDSVGHTHSHSILKGIRKDLDDEALRITKLIKFEKPALQSGSPIKVKFVLPIEFILSDEKKNKEVDFEKQK